MPQAKPLPQFDRPPLNEVAFGIQFDPLKNLRVGHMGLYWQKIRQNYPHAEEHIPVAHLVEQKELVAARPFEGEAISLEAGPLAPRCWFVSEDGLELVQLQSDRFLRNWRQIQGKEIYPRYVSLFKKFQKDWKDFLSFLDEERIGPVNIDQCELTYINHVPQGEGWSEPKDLAKVFKSCADVASFDFLPGPELTSWRTSYLLPSGRGRLHVQVKPGIRNRDRRPIIVLDMTARGIPVSTHQEDVESWFATAHEWIVRGFTDLTTAHMHKLWGRNDGR